MRGAPHAHCLLWLVEDGQTVKKSIVFNGKVMEIDVPKPAPTYKNCVFGKDGEERENGKKDLIDFIHSIITIDNGELATRNVHGHRFTCQKSHKNVIKVQPNEGHGKFKPPGDSAVLVFPKCRFGFPRFPMKTTNILEPLNPTEYSDEEIKIATKNFKKIQKFMIRQTFAYKKEEVTEERKRFFNLSFDEFLSHIDLTEAQYLMALRTSIKGKAKLFLKRSLSQVFINNYNENIMKKHDSNMDISIVFDEYQVAQYLVSYLTKAEAGCSKLLRQLDEECSKQGIGFSDKLKKFRKALDQTREVSIQEAVYRLMGFPVTKASRKVKFISTADKQHRDGLLKSNLDDLEEGESPFLNSLIDYYESRPDSLEYLTLADFGAHYEIVSKNEDFEECEDNMDNETEKLNSSPLLNLKNRMGKIRKRLRPAVIRYILNKRDKYEYVRGILLLFTPFRNEQQEISEQDAEKIYKHITEDPERNLNLEYQLNFYQPFQSLLEDIEVKVDEVESDSEDDEDINGEECDKMEETTAKADIETFLRDFNEEKIETTDLMEKKELLVLIRTLNREQRKIFDDVMERLMRTDHDSDPFYLYVSGDAGKTLIFWSQHFILNVCCLKMFFINFQMHKKLFLITI